MFLDNNHALPYKFLVNENNITYTTALTQALQAYSTWAIWEDWGMTKGEFMRWWRLGVQSEELYNMPNCLMPGARDALWQLSDQEWNIHIATSRLNVFGEHDVVAKQTAQWLRDVNIPYRELSLVNDKHRIIGDAIVDDRMDNLNVDSHGVCMLFDAPHNSRDEVPGYYTRVANWDEVLETVGALV
jgi:5'(3')-deoxyribonucleotidase